MQRAQQRKPKKEDQFLYLGRWVNKSTFRTFVYNGKIQKLANSYHEYQNLIDSGLWFNTPELAQEKIDADEAKQKALTKKLLDEAAQSAPDSSKIRKQKDGSPSTDS